MARLLLVEDQPELIRSSSRMFRSRGHIVEEVRSIDEARRLTTPVHCAVLDIDLPDGSGLELARELRAKNLAESIVFFSAQPDDEMRIRAERLAPFVAKSSGMEELFRVVEREIRIAKRLAAVGSGTFVSVQGEAEGVAADQASKTRKAN